MKPVRVLFTNTRIGQRTGTDGQAVVHQRLDVLGLLGQRDYLSVALPEVLD